MWSSSAPLVKLSFSDPWIWINNSTTGIQTRRSGGQLTPGLFGFCFHSAPILGGSQHYIFGWVSAMPNDTIFLDPTGDWLDLAPISEIDSYNYPKELQAAVTFKCGSKSFTHWKDGDEASSIRDGYANVRYAHLKYNQSFFTIPNSIV